MIRPSFAPQPSKTAALQRRRRAMPAPPGACALSDPSSLAPGKRGVPGLGQPSRVAEAAQLCALCALLLLSTLALLRRLSRRPVRAAEAGGRARDPQPVSPPLRQLLGDAIALLGSPPALREGHEVVSTISLRSKLASAALPLPQSRLGRGPVRSAAASALSDFHAMSSIVPASPAEARCVNRSLFHLRVQYSRSHNMHRR